MYCMWLAEIEDAKNRHLGTIAQLCQAVSSQLRHVSTIETAISPHVPHNMVNFSPLVAEISNGVWGRQTGHRSDSIGRTVLQTVAQKLQILSLKNSQFKTACEDDSGYITQKNSKNQKGDITCQHNDYMAM